MGRHLDGGSAFLVAGVDGDVREVAVSGDTVAWIRYAGGTYSIVAVRLPQ